MYYLPEEYHEVDNHRPPHSNQSKDAFYEHSQSWISDKIVNYSETNVSTYWQIIKELLLLKKFNRWPHCLICVHPADGTCRTPREMLDFEPTQYIIKILKCK